MTRKCIMCKSKNYKNTYSFFSAPKDPEIRRLWQEAINIKDYTVNEDTYVCSKHFRKDDIITHWVSGVPPHVITIKYKKCRLRPGAVPVPLDSTNNSVNDTTSETQKNGIILDGKKYFIEPKKKDLDSSSKVHKSEEASNESLNCNLEDEIYEYIPEDSQEPEEMEIETNPTRKRQKLHDRNTSNQEIILVDCTNDDADIQVNDIEVEKNKSNKPLDDLDNTETIVTYLPKRTYIKVKKGLKKADSNILSEDMVSSMNWHDATITEKFAILKDNMDDINENLNKSDYEPVHLAQEIIYCDNTLSFEDFIEMYNEVSLPSSWFTSLVSKDHDTTVIYCCMNISSSGMPYLEKKIFLSNNMILRCGVFNKEINIANISKTGRNRVVTALADIEEFIKDFDQMSICPGILGENFAENSNQAVVTLDGSTWRHSQCSMILSENQTTCLQCASLMRRKKS
ncbi:hypothetical protein TSAR_000388 [Trichomalopsis sarcophagae]|uniref:THAP-type domain-containing protein n=1 Tax=Trichomalopsis sarcophagae TaxID=543379 RepID=A0A232F7A8_9HYME|nr:hypothetical protein TSAR_000388 [Trichomalopsis sarcophagae]